MYYTEIPKKTQVRECTSFKNCAPKSRCNDYKKCPHCFNIWKKKQYAKVTNHLKEKDVNKFKYKHFLTIVSLDTQITPREKNANIDLFLQELINGKRYANGKANLFYNSEYISFKRISLNDKFGINPHLHIIHLTNKAFKRDRKLKELLSKYNLRIDKQDIYKDTKTKTYLESIKKLTNYGMKLSYDTLAIEKSLNITKSKSYIKKSSLFNSVIYTKSRNILYKYIYTKAHQIKHEAKTQIKQAKQTFKRYKKSNPKGYIRGLKALKNKLHAISSKKEKKLTRLLRRANALNIDDTHSLN